MVLLVYQTVSAMASPPVAPDVRMSRKDLDWLRFSHAAAQCTPEKIHQVVTVVHVGQNDDSILGPSDIWNIPRHNELLGIFHIHMRMRRAPPGAAHVGAQLFYSP